MEYVVGGTKQIENYNTKTILQKIREFDNDELVAAKVYERVEGLKHGDHVDEFFLNAYLLRILDILIYIDNERQHQYLLQQQIHKQLLRKLIQNL